MVRCSTLLRCAAVAIVTAGCGASSANSWESAGIALSASSEELPLAYANAGAIDSGGPASRALERAREKKQALRGERGERLDELREEAIRAYCRVHERWPSAGVLAAEAAFRAGELLRAAGEPDRALEQFAVAKVTKDGGEFVARALYEIGHVQRREGRAELALAAFEELIASAIADEHLRDMASVWSARVLAERGQEADAERVLRRLVQTAKDPLDRIRAFDELMLLVIARGELEGAAGWLRECKFSVTEQSNELTSDGKRVVSALENMRGLKALQSAIADRMKVPGYDPLR